MLEGWDKITPDQVLKFDKPLTKFLCPITANIYNIIFGRFKIRNVDKNTTLLEIAPEVEDYIYADQTDEVRLLEYTLPADILRVKNIGTTVEFKVGGKEVKNFRLLERHYFKDKLIKSFDFIFGFCIPNSTNTWESIYELPTLTESEIKGMTISTKEFKSDSFYFADSKIIMHHRAGYDYIEMK